MLHDNKNENPDSAQSSCKNPLLYTVRFSVQSQYNTGTVPTATYTAPRYAALLCHSHPRIRISKAGTDHLPHNGIECMINTTCTNLLFFFFCVLSHTLSAGIVWIVLFTFFRNLVGGYHAIYSAFTNRINASCPSAVFLYTPACSSTFLNTIPISF